MKVMVIDDDMGVQEAVKAILEFGGFEVFVSDKADALFKLQKKELPKVILLDLLLSGTDGRKVAKKIKDDSHTKHIPIIMLSAHPSARKAALESGAEDFIAKPFEMDELIDKINKWLKK